jgi:hypothetical protein
VTVSSILTHLSYDVFAGNGQFPLLAPLSFQLFLVPWAFWPSLESMAVVSAVIGNLDFGSRRG